MAGRGVRSSCGEQLHQVIAGLDTLLGGNLVGVYLHGSLAMGCFNPERSDLNLLVVTDTRLNPDAKRQEITMLLTHSGRPRPIEISSLALPDLHPGRHPAPFDLHFSAHWRPHYERALAVGSWPHEEPAPHADPDLAAHITILRRRGICLQGRPIAAVFPTVPAADYVDAILGDFTAARERVDQDTAVYFILNACRVCTYLATGAICSKDEGGRWALAWLPPGQRPLIGQALAVYRGTATPGPFDLAAVGRFADALAAEFAARRERYSAD